MSATNLWSKLTSLGVDLSAAAGKLRVRARPGVITPELQSEIAQSKEELLAVLAARPTEMGLCAHAAAWQSSAILLPGAPVGHPALRSGEYRL